MLRTKSYLRRSCRLVTYTHLRQAPCTYSVGGFFSFFYLHKFSARVRVLKDRRLTKMETTKFQALLARATHPATPVEEARTSAMILAKMIVASNWAPGANGSAELDAAKSEIRKLATLVFQGRQTEKALRETIARLEANQGQANQGQANQARGARQPASRWLFSRFPCQCRECGQAMPKGARVFWTRDASGSSVLCETCKGE